MKNFADSPKGKVFANAEGFMPINPNEKPSIGKYKFNTFADLTVTTQRNSGGIPLKSVLYHFNNGDVIDVQKMFFNDEGEGWEAQVSAITEQNRSVPFSILTKVSDTTPITTNISRTEKTLEGGVGRNAGNSSESQNTDINLPPHEGGVGNSINGGHKAVANTAIFGAIGGGVGYLVAKNLIKTDKVLIPMLIGAAAFAYYQIQNKK